VLVALVQAALATGTLVAIGLFAWLLRQRKKSTRAV